MSRRSSCIEVFRQVLVAVAEVVLDTADPRIGQSLAALGAESPNSTDAPSYDGNFS
jgi:hypothetical protein